MIETLWSIPLGISSICKYWGISEIGIGEDENASFNISKYLFVTYFEFDVTKLKIHLGVS